MHEQIVIVDDDNDILELLEYNLTNAGYDVMGFSDTKHVRRVLNEEKVDLIIMDRNLPDIEGSLYIEMLRSKNVTVPVIFLSAKGSLSEIKEGFLRGADDYISKPFDLEELLLRVKAVLSRYKQNEIDQKGIVRYRDLELDLNRNYVKTNGAKETPLTKLESNLLQVMIANKGKVLDRDFLIKQIWKDTEHIHQKTVNVAMKRLKEKIDPSRQKEYIKTIRGVGYLIP
ncbi:MAG: response regulator transcription factor [Sulfurimonas sp.]|jgi:DNA-binding response OmpR family regulator|nr:response regulator transcription factor [Sulfurimonas sp.]